MEVEETNVPGEQVNSTDKSSNTAETVTPDDSKSSYDKAYDKAFESMDLDNPDMSLFAEETNVESEPEQPVDKNKNEVETPVDSSDVFGLNEEGYLKTPLVDRGIEIPVTPDELYSFANKGINYERKNADIKPYAEHLRALKDSDVSVEDLASLVDLSKGNKDALKHLISKFDVDVYDVDVSDTEYTPDVSKYEVDEVKDIWTGYVESAPEKAETVSQVFNSLDISLREELNTAEVLPLFIEDVNSGMFEKILPEARKIKALYPDLTWIQSYAQADKKLSEKAPEVPSADVIPPIDKAVERSTTSADAIWDDPEAYQNMLQNMKY